MSSRHHHHAGGGGSSSSQVRVGVRVRPLTSKEIQQGGKSSVVVAPAGAPAAVVGIGQRRFTYDAAFDSTVSQLELYESVSAPLLKSYVDGYNATIMAYGQTGSGKTFTMGSEAHTEPESSGSSHTGLIPRFMQDFFEALQKKKEASDLKQQQQPQEEDDGSSSSSSSPTLIEYQLSASFLEVYGEDVYDLLDRDRKSLPLREDSNGGVVISGLTSRPVTSAAQALQVLHDGTMNRTTAATLMNLTSSRSHAVFTIYLKQVVRAGEVDVTNMSRFTFVDLAGSERMKKTGAEGERAREGIKINEGLLALGNVINALADEERSMKEKQKVHVPYRQSKLTRLLQDALGGNSQTLFLACVSPSDTNASETLSTLHYANRARNIRNAPTKNVDPTAAELQRLHALNRVLQCELIKQKFCSDPSDSSSFDDATEERIGHVDEMILRRKDVEEYLQRLSTVAGSVGGKMIGSPVMLPGAVSTSSTPPSAHATKQAIVAPERAVEAVAGPVGDLNQSICEKYDDGKLDDVDPDKDMAILDQLLELQRHDHEYDREKRKDDDQLKEVEGELEKQEKMLLQLRESMKVYHDMKEKYEALMTEVQQLEAEKATLAQQLEQTVKDPSAGCSAAIKRKLEKVEQSLSRARSETKKHREKYRKAEEQAKKVQVLERKISSLKQGKVTLMKKQKEAAARYREVTEAKTKELMLLKRRERAQGQKLSKLETEVLHHKTNLDKRKVYCAKLSDKLKQTESHLVKLLSMRQRDLSERMSLVGNNRRRASDLKTVESNEYDKAFAPMNESVKSFNFILEKMVSDKVSQAALKQQYEERVAVYSDTMRRVVEEVNLLNDARKTASEMDCEENQEVVKDREDNIADLELKLELLGTELEELKGRLQPDEDDSKLDDDKAVKKMMTNMSGPVLRTLLMETFKKYADAELERQKLSNIADMKESALQSYENEVESLNHKIESLSKNLSDIHSHVSSEEDPMVAIQRLEEEKSFFDGEARMLSEKLRHAESHSSKLEETLREVQRNYDETRERYVLAQATLQQVGSNNESEETLERLQEVWRELGISSASRDQVRQDIENCLGDTCARKLREASDLKSQTEMEIRNLAQALDSMKAALGMDNGDESKSTASTLLDCRDDLQSQVGKLEPNYKFAVARREKLLKDLRGLVDALGVPSNQLTSDLQDLLERGESINYLALFQQLQKPTPSNDQDGYNESTPTSLTNEDGLLPVIAEEQEDHSSRKLSTNDAPPPPNSLQGDYLTRCERDISKLRVKKSEELVRNREYQQKAFSLSSEMHLSAEELQKLFQECIQPQPEWWSRDVMHLVAEKVSSETSAINATEIFSQHLKAALVVLEKVAKARRSISSALRSIVERAQKTLLDIVGRELDASEAYASFHNALFRLPALSEELVNACISEMEALVTGVEAMTQSEIEALTVVWEALGVTPAERREFWGQVEGSTSENLSDENNPFLQVAELASHGGEEWVISATEVARQKFEHLEQRLSKLDNIHKEVERLKSRQDTKSSILSLDSEVRILNANLSDFEDTKCNKQRLLTKKSGATTLLKEERFRKQMQGKFTTKLEQLGKLLRVWEQEQGEPFDASVLSDDVRMLLSSPANMESIVEKRTKLMPLRTVQTKTPGKKRPLDDADEESSSSDDSRPGSTAPRTRLTPPRKRQARGTSSVARSTSSRAPKLPPQQQQKSTRVKAGGAARVAPKRPERNENQKSTINEIVKVSAQPKRQTRKRDSAALLPFGQILSPAQKRRPDADSNE